ncbi:hypothetical protein ABHB17_13395, partial [[Eubacterium] siraeum]
CGNYILHESEYDVHIFCVALDIIIYPAPHSAPFRGKGFGDRGCKQALFLKKDFFYKLKQASVLRRSL